MLVNYFPHDFLELSIDELGGWREISTKTIKKLKSLGGDGSPLFETIGDLYRKYCADPDYFSGEDFTKAVFRKNVVKNLMKDYKQTRPDYIKDDDDTSEEEEDQESENSQEEEDQEDEDSQEENDQEDEDSQEEDKSSEKVDELADNLNTSISLHN